VKDGSRVSHRAGMPGLPPGGLPDGDRGAGNGSQAPRQPAGETRRHTSKGIRGGSLKNAKFCCCKAASQGVSSQQMARQKKTGYAAPAQTFGGWLREMRERKYVPLRVVAAAADMDQAHLSKVELGHRVPTEKQAAALARYFGVHPHDMEARRIAERFRQDFADNPAAVKAVQILNDGPLHE